MLCQQIEDNRLRIRQRSAVQRGRRRLSSALRPNAENKFDGMDDGGTLESPEFVPGVTVNRHLRSQRNYIDRLDIVAR